MTRTKTSIPCATRGCDRKVYWEPKAAGHSMYCKTHTQEFNADLDAMPAVSYDTTIFERAARRDDDPYGGAGSLSFRRPPEMPYGIDEGRA